MSQINLNNKTFILLENSENGVVNSETRFDYKQEGTLVTANYSGGTVIKGHYNRTTNSFRFVHALPLHYFIE